jgi:hypothetical protein
MPTMKEFGEKFGERGCDTLMASAKGLSDVRRIGGAEMAAGALVLRKVDGRGATGREDECGIISR